MKNKVLSVMLAGMIVLAMGFSSPQTVAVEAEGGEWKLIGQFGGSTGAATTVGITVYAGIGLKMNIIEFVNPNEPLQVGATPPFADFVTDIAVSATKALVSAGSGGVSLVDVGTPATPKVLGTWTSAGFAEGAALKGDLAVVADGPLGLRLVDFSMPSVPKEVGSAYPFNYAFDVAISGNYAFVAAGESGLLVADISDPTHPKEAGSLDTTGYAYGVEINGSIAYIADGWAGIQTMDISIPAKPVLLGNTPTNGWSLSVAVGKGQLYSGNGGMGLQVFDLTDARAPKAAGTLHSGGAVRQVAAGENGLFAADSMKGIQMIDTSQADKPKTVGSFGTLPYARRATLAGEYLYVASGVDGAMYAINVKDPANPYQAGKFQADGNASDVQVSGKYAYLLTFMDSTNYLMGVNISDPAEMKMVDAIGLGDVQPMDAAPREAAINGNVLYVADEFGVRIFDISNPSRVSQQGQIQLDIDKANMAVGLALKGNYAYVAVSGVGLHIIDISDNANPKDVGRYGSLVGSVALSGGTLFAGQYGDGISAATISTDGKKLTQVGKLALSGQVEDVTVANGMLFAGMGNSGMQVIDASNPAKMKVAQTLDTPGFAWNAEAAGNLAYVSDGAGGLLIYEKGGTVRAAQPIAAKGLGKTTSAFTSGAEEPKFPFDSGASTSSDVCTVTSTASSGAGTLAECITKVKKGGKILFDTGVFPPKKPAKILLDNALPELQRGSVTIDGSEAGVIVDGGQKVDWGLRISSSHNTIMGLQFTNFTNGGIQVGFPSRYNVIGGDHSIGAGPSGQGNALYGNFSNILLMDTSYNTIKGNFIGTLAGGRQAGPYSEQGVVLNNYATYNFIGGKGEGEKNIISGNNRGVDFGSTTNAHNVLAGNYIGTDVSGTKAIPNYDFGVLMEVGSRYNVVGGISPEERNIISGNKFSGVTISDDGTTQNTVIGNYIGLDVSGTKALPNGTGMGIFQATYNRIGGGGAGEGNLVSGNQNGGLNIFGMGPSHAIVLGNTFGLDVNGKPLPNGNGINIYGGSHALIGGMGQGSGNTVNSSSYGIQFTSANISHNWAAGNILQGRQAGVRIESGAAHNLVVKNDASKSAVGISVDSGDFNTLRGNLGSIAMGKSANGQLAAPVLVNVDAASASGTTCAGCVVDIYMKDPSQVMSYLGFVLADASGRFTFAGKMSGSVLATATDLLGNTSGFSNVITVK